MNLHEYQAKQLFREYGIAVSEAFLHLLATKQRSGTIIECRQMGCKSSSSCWRKVKQVGLRLLARLKKLKSLQKMVRE